MRALAAALAVGAVVAGCGGKASEGEAAATASAVLPPVPAPPDLALECVVPAPDATWEKARAQIGGAASFLPRTAGGLAAVMLHFPIALSEAIDGSAPAVCAGSLSSDGSAARAVLGVHLRWPDRLLDGLTKGKDARFTSRVDAATQIALLEARAPEDAVMPSGVLGNYLLIAARAEDLTALGPYVARTMPSRAKDFPVAGVRIAGAPSPSAADLTARVPAAAMGGPFAAASARVWAAVRERAAAVLPSSLPFGGAAAEALSLLPSLEGAEVRVVLGDAGLRVEVTAPVRKGSEGDARVRALPAGDASPLLAMPKDTLAGVLLRRTPGAANGASPNTASPNTASPNTASPNTASPDGTANTTSPNSASPNSTSSGSAAANTASPGGAGSGAAAGGGAGGGGLPAGGGLDLAKVLGVADPKDAAALEAAGRAFEGAAGDWLAAGFAFDGTGPSGFVRAAVRDGDALDRALKELVALVDRAAPVDPIKGKDLRIKAGKTVLENIPGDVYRLRIARGSAAAKKAAEPPAAPTDTPGAVDVLFRRRDDVFVAATGYASRDALRALLEAPSGESLATVPAVAEPLTRLGAGVLFASFFDPGRITASRAGKPGSLSPAAVVVALDRAAEGALTLRLTLDAAAPAVAELSRWLAP